MEKNLNSSKQKIRDKIDDIHSNRIRGLAGRKTLYEEASKAKCYLLDLEVNNEISELVDNENLKYEMKKYDTLNNPEVFQSIIDEKVNGRYRKIRRNYRAQREALKAKDAKDPSQKEEHDKYLADLEKKMIEELDAYRKELEKQVQAQASQNTKKVDLEIAKKTRDQAIESGKKALLEKNEHSKNKWGKKYSHKVANIEKKYSKALKKGKVESTSDVYKLPTNVVLEIKDLCMYFGGVKAVDGLSFDVKQGEIFGLIGPNGAGKTTVFNCITQFYKPTRGQLLFKNKMGKVINLTDRAVHDVILEGIVRTFQNIEVIKEVSVLDNLLIAAHRQYHTNLFEHAVHSAKLQAEEVVIRQRALKVLDFMGLSIYANWYAWGLPYGILKKIEIARTLMCNPQLIILDEPAAGLNDSETADLAKLIRKIKKEYNCTILLVEHDMGLVMDICERICAISFGKMLAQGTPKEIQANKDVQTAYLGVQEEDE